MPDTNAEIQNLVASMLVISVPATINPTRVPEAVVVHTILSRQNLPVLKS
jgi:hypothetical protein